MITSVLLLSFAVVHSVAQSAHATAPPLTLPNPAAVREVTQGKRADASAAWWGFDPADSTAILQAVFDSKAKRVLIPYMGKPWIVRPLQIHGNQEIDLAPGVVILAKRGEYQRIIRHRVAQVLKNCKVGRLKLRIAIQQFSIDGKPGDLG